MIRAIMDSADPREPDQDSVVAWASAWVDPSPTLVQQFGRDGNLLPLDIADGVSALKVALARLAASRPSENAGVPPASDARTVAILEVDRARRSLATILAGVAAAARERFTASSEPADATTAVAVHHAAIASTLPGSLARGSLQIDLARVYLGRRLVDRDDEASVDLGLAVATEALRVLDTSTGGDPVPSAIPAMVEVDGVIAELLGERFSWRGADADLDLAIEHATRSRSRAETITPDRRAAADDRLALLLRLRHDHRGDDRDLDLAIAHAENAVAGTSPDHAEYPMRLGNLGLRLATRFNLSGNRADLDRSINLARTGLASGGLSPHDRRRLLGNLAIRLKTRHAQASDPDDLDAAIAMEAEAMSLAPTGTPQPLWLLNNYGISISARYTRRGNPADLDLAIALAEEALALSPPGVADRPSRLSNLSIVMSTRYEHRGDPADLDRAIELSGQSIAETPAGSPFLNIRQHNHGTHLAIRYDRQGAPADLDAAIDLAHAAIDGTPADSPDQPSRLGNLALRYAARYAGRGRVADLEASIREGERALALTPVGALERPIRLGSLASALALRWYRTTVSAPSPYPSPIAAARASTGGSGEGSNADGETAPASGDDLARAIALTTEALALMDAGNPERAASLASLAHFHHRRFEVSREVGDLTAAISAAEESVLSTPEGHPGRASRLSLLATLLEAGDTGIGSRALDLHRLAWTAVTGMPGFAGFAVVRVGSALAAALRRALHTGGDSVADELWTVLSVTLDALDGYLARLPLDADDDALFAVGTYGHLHSWRIEVAVSRVERARSRNDDPDPLVREAFTAIERSKGRRVVSRLQAGALRPTLEAQPLVDALERLKPELDRLETLLFGEAPPSAVGTGERQKAGDGDAPDAAVPPRAPLGWLGELLPSQLGQPTSTRPHASTGPERSSVDRGSALLDWALPNSNRAWVADLDADRAVADRARMAVRHADLHSAFSDLLRRIGRSDPTYATARGYAPPRTPEAVARSLPMGATLVVLAPMAARTAIVTLASDDTGRVMLSLETFDVTEAQWARLVDRTFRRGEGRGAGDASWALANFDRELEAALRAIADRFVPTLAALLPDVARANVEPHLVLVPTGAMHRLPLHAVPWAPRGIARWDGVTRLTDRYLVTYASMADLLPLVSPRPVAEDGIASLAPGLAMHPADTEPHATVALAAGLARAAIGQARDRSTASGGVALRVRAEASRDEVLSRAVLSGRRFGFVATHGRAGGTSMAGLLVHRGNGFVTPRSTAVSAAAQYPMAGERTHPNPLAGDEGAYGRHDENRPGAIGDPLPGPRSETGARSNAGTGQFPGTWVTSAELLARLDLGGVDHLQLLACSTHADDPAPGDHLSSLLTSVLICGARSVGGTLWAVDEVAAVLVGFRVGTALIGGDRDKARALRDATRWLRVATGAEIAAMLADLGSALGALVPASDPAHGVVARLAEQFGAIDRLGGGAPFAGVVHWAPYVLHGSPLVGSHG